jgi:hypothetical protein
MTTEQLPPDEQEAMETRLRLTLLASLGHGSLMAGTQEGGLFGPEDPHLHRLTVDLAKAMEAWTTVVSEVGGLGHRTGYRGFWTALEGTSETHPIFVDAVHHAALNFPDPGPTEGDLEECRDLEAMRLGMTAEDFGTPKAIPFQPSPRLAGWASSSPQPWPSWSGPSWPSWAERHSWPGREQTWPPHYGPPVRLNPDKE